MEDLVIREQENGTEVVEFREGPTKTHSGGLTIRRRTTPQVMHSTDGGKADPVRLFKLWLSKRQEGMKNTGPLFQVLLLYFSKFWSFPAVFISYILMKHR